jgi:hypothetical protein
MCCSAGLLRAVKIVPSLRARIETGKVCCFTLRGN